MVEDNICVFSYEEITFLWRDHLVVCGHNRPYAIKSFDCALTGFLFKSSYT